MPLTLGSEFKTHAATGLSSLTTGVKSTYTCPDGRIAIVHFYAAEELGSSGGTAQIEITVGAGPTTVEVERMTGGQQQACFIVLQPGDTIRFNITATGTDSWSFALGIEERDASEGDGS